MEREREENRTGHLHVIFFVCSNHLARHRTAFHFKVVGSIGVTYYASNLIFYQCGAHMARSVSVVLRGGRKNKNLRRVIYIKGSNLLVNESYELPVAVVSPPKAHKDRHGSESAQVKVESESLQRRFVVLQVLCVVEGKKKREVQDIECYHRR